MSRNEYLRVRNNKGTCSSGLTKFRCCLFYCLLQCVLRFFSLFMLFMLNDQNISGVNPPSNTVHRYMQILLYLLW